MKFNKYLSLFILAVLPVCTLFSQGTIPGGSNVSKTLHNPMQKNLNVDDFDIINSNSGGDIEFIAGDGVTNGNFLITDSTDLGDKISFIHASGVWVMSIGGLAGDRVFAINTNSDASGSAINLQLGVGGQVTLGSTGSVFFFSPVGTFVGNIDLGQNSTNTWRNINMSGKIREVSAGAIEIEDASGSAVYRRKLAFDNMTSSAAIGIYNPLQADYGEQVTFTSNLTTGIEVELNATTNFPILTELHYIIDKILFPNGLPLTAEGGVTFNYLKGNSSIIGSEYKLKKTALDAWDISIIDAREDQMSVTNKPLEFRFAAVSGITQANPGVVTVPSGHGFVVGGTVGFEDIVGMTELNGTDEVLTAVAATTITITSDTTAFTAYTSGGVVFHRNKRLDLASGTHRYMDDIDVTVHELNGTITTQTTYSAGDRDEADAAGSETTFISAQLGSNLSAQYNRDRNSSVALPGVTSISFQIDDPGVFNTATLMTLRAKFKGDQPED